MRPQSQDNGSSRASASWASPGLLGPLVSSQRVIQKFLHNAARTCWPCSCGLSQPAWAGQTPGFYLPQASQLLLWPPPSLTAGPGSDSAGNRAGRWGAGPASLARAGRIQASQKRVKMGPNPVCVGEDGERGET